VHQLPQIAAQLDKLHSDVEITRAKLASLLVRAPVAGRLTAMDLKIGESRNRGERLGELTPASGFKVVADVDEFYVGRVKPGSAATANIGDVDVPLLVERVYPQVRGGTITVDLKFASAAPATLAAGQAVQGRFSLGIASQATLLAAGPYLQETGGDFVFVLDQGGSRAVKRRIHVGRRNSEQLEVLAGLAPGEHVITSDYQGYGGIDLIDIH
jgi:HlyD family secretion protein